MLEDTPLPEIYFNIVVHENANRIKKRALELFVEIPVFLGVQLSEVDRIEIRIGPQSRSAFCYKCFSALLFSSCSALYLIFCCETGKTIRTVVMSA